MIKNEDTCKATDVFADQELTGEVVKVEADK